MQTTSAEPFSNDAEPAENYTFGVYEHPSSDDTGAALARAVRAINLDDTTDDLGEEGSQHAVSGNYKAGKDTVSRSLHPRDDVAYLPRGARSSSHDEPSTVPGRQFPMDKFGSNVLNNTTVPNAEKNAVPGNNTERAANESSSDGQSSHAAGEAQDLSNVIGSFLDEHTLADTAYRKSCFSYLGSWDTDSERNQPIYRQSPVERFSSSRQSHQSDVNWNAVVTSCATGESSSSGSRGQARKSSGAASKSTGSKNGFVSGSRIQKRPPEDDDDKDNDDEPGSGKKPKYDDSLPKYSGKLLACPFQKHNPWIYNTNGADVTFRTCSGPGFKNISRLK